MKFEKRFYVIMGSKVIVTHHGKRRLKERVGTSKNSAQPMAERVRLHGIGHEDCTGELATWLYRKRLRCGAYAKIYGDKVYIYGRENALITVYSLPKEFKEWRLFVKKDALERYQRYTESLHRFTNAPPKVSNSNRSYLRDPNTIKAVLNRHFKDEGIELCVVRVTRKEGRYIIDFVSDIPDTEHAYFKRIREWARNSLKISVCLQHLERSDGTLVLKSDYLKVARNK